MQLRKLTFGAQPIVVDELPLSDWTIVNANTLTVNGDTVTQLSVGGWNESMFISFTVPETGSYKICYDYAITTAKIGNHGTNGFGLWLTSNNPNVSGDAQYQFYTNSANRTGLLIGLRSEIISGRSGSMSFNAALTAGTTYYLWYPGGALDDGTTYTLTFKNIRILNNPVRFTATNNIIVFPGFDGRIVKDTDITYNVICNGSNGSVVASPSTGIAGTEVTLTNTPNTGYKFDSYTIAGAAFKNPTQFDIANANVYVSGHFSVAPKLTVDLNGAGEEQTTTFRNASSDWNNFRVFKTNKNRTTGTFNNFLQNISRAGSNFTLWYYLDCYYKNTSRAYGQIQYTSDSSNLVGKTAGWTKAGLDSQNPRYQKSRWRSVTVNVSKGGNLKFIFGQPSSDIWYTGAMYWAVDKNLLE